MVLTVLKGLGKAYLKSQKSAIKGVKPGTNLVVKQLKNGKAKCNIRNTLMQLETPDMK